MGDFYIDKAGNDTHGNGSYIIFSFKDIVPISYQVLTLNQELVQGNNDFLLKEYYSFKIPYTKIGLDGKLKLLVTTQDNKNYSMTVSLIKELQFRLMT